MKRRVIYFIIICAAIILTYIIYGLIMPKKGNKNESEIGKIEEIEINSIENINNETKFSEKEYETNKDDETVINTKENGKLALENITIKKKGNTSNLRNSDSQGLNSAIRAEKDGCIEATKANILTKGKGSSAVVAYGKKAKININESEITTEGERSRGILATGGANIEAKNVKVTTNGYKSSGVATDTGSGNIKIHDSEIITNGKDSPGIYSTGIVIARNIKVKTNNSEAIVIDGYNLADFTNSKLESSKKRGALLIYTGPPAKQKIKGMLKMRNSTFSVNEGPAFYVTNTDGDIYLENVNLSIYDNKLLEVGVDKYRELGQEHPVENPRGGDVTLTAKNQQLLGEIEADSQSTVKVKLENSTYTGKINVQNMAKKIVVELDKDSIWNLTGDTYITELNASEEAKINNNGYTIHYIDKEN